MAAHLLGGKLAPFGLSVSFLRKPLAVVRDTIRAWRCDELHQTIEESGPIAFPECVTRLEPLEAPWTTEVLVDSGDWTTYLNNGIDGGDPTAAASYLGTRLECDCVMGMHVPPNASGHQATQLWLSGPDGVPPLMSKRTISATAEDGHWSWIVTGEPQPWEHVDRYAARRVRQRFDRPLLVEYLAAIGIHVDDDAFYGGGVCVRQVVTFARRQETAAQVRARFGW